MKTINVRSAFFVLLGIMLLFFAACGPGGSAGDDSGGGTTTTTLDPGPQVFQLQGTLYNPLGGPIPSASVFVFSSRYSLTTAADGSWGVNPAPFGPHSVLISNANLGYSDFLAWVNLPAGTKVDLKTLLRQSPVAGVTNSAASALDLVSNKLVDSNNQPYTSTLHVPAQLSQTYTVNKSQVAGASFSLEQIDLNKTLTFPLPSSQTREAGLNPTLARQAPSLVVNVGPSLLRDLEPNAAYPGQDTVLTMANPDGLPLTSQILHFDMENHQWVQHTVQGVPQTLQHALAGMPISEGGFYGLFMEDNSHIGSARGTIEAPAGSLVYLGDKYVGMAEEDGIVVFENIHVPTNGEPLEVVVLDPATKPATIRKTSVTMQAGQWAVITPLAGNVTRVELRSSKNSMVADGTDSANITALVYDEKDQLVSSGILVNFFTSAGTLSADSAPTAYSGTASVSLTTNTKPGPVTVTASAENVSSEALTVNFVPGPPSSIVLNSDPSSITADGVSTSTIEAQVLDEFSNPVATSNVVTFSVKDPNGAAYLNIAPGKKAVDDDGKASSIITASSTARDGVYTITADSGDASRTVTVQFVSAEVGSVAISAGQEEPQIVANGKTFVTLLAKVLNEAGNPMPDDTVVTFTTTAGLLKNQAADAGSVDLTATIIGGAGEARVLLYSSTKTGIASVSASSGGRTSFLDVAFIAGAAAKLNISANPANLVADGLNTSTLEVLALDANDNPIADGHSVTFGLVNTGTGSISPIVVELDGGLATSTYTVPTSVPEADKNPVVLTATMSNGLTASTQILLSGPQIATISLSADPATLPANGQSTAKITALVSIVGGGPAPDRTPVTFEIISGGGQIIGSSIIETAGGYAIATLQAGTVPAVGVIRAKAGNTSAELEIPYNQGSITLGVIPSVLLGTGLETAKITATAAKANGDPVTPGTNVLFSIDQENLGDLDPATSPTDNFGEATTTFLASNTGGTVTVTGKWVLGLDPQGKEIAITGTQQIVVLPPPVSLNLDSVSPVSIAIQGTGGDNSANVIFEVRDSQNNLVADGYRVNFALLSGPNGGEFILPLYAYTKDGKVGTTLISGTKAGPTLIKATYHNNTNVSTTTAGVSIDNGPPVGEAFGVKPNWMNLPGLEDADALLENVVSASAGDINGQAVPDGTSISFKTYNTGGFFSVPASGITTGGVATNTYKAGPPKPHNGWVSLTSEATNGGRTTRVSTLAVDPFNSEFIYAATNGGGVYKSIDSGASWSNISGSSEIPGQNWIDPFVNDVVADPVHKDYIYAGTGFEGQGQLFRSFDGGATWNSNNANQILGAFQTNGAVRTIECDDGSDYMWIGTQGSGLYTTNDRTRTSTATAWGIAFSQADGVLGAGRSVYDIARSPNTHGATAVLYAGGLNGVFMSSDGGGSWAQAGTFTGDRAQVLRATNVGGNDIVFAGTSQAALWMYSPDGAGGYTWTQFKDGLGNGVRATPPILTLSSVGNGVIRDVDVGVNTKSESWTLVCITEAAGGGVFALTGTVSGYSGTATVGQPYTQADGKVLFTITPGEVDFEVGDTFNFQTIRDPGTDVRDILVDQFNKKIYIATYFSGDLEPHAVGNIYVRNLLADGTIDPAVPWTSASRGLPQYDPPDDETLFAVHSLALDDPAAPGALFAGGEGINLYKAIDGMALHGTDLSQGVVKWEKSMAGLTNRIMARTPIVLTSRTEIKGLEQKLVAADIDEDTEEVNWVSYNYKWYVEDDNGNPPYSGSTIRIKTYRWTGNDYKLLEDITKYSYGDSAFAPGTWRDRNDLSTDLPMFEGITFGLLIDKAELIFETSCADEVPGCSSKSQLITLPFIGGTLGLLTISSSAKEIQANGSDQVVITANVIFEDGEQAPDGTEVTFKANMGTPLTTKVLTANGTASFTLTAGFTAGTAIVEATALDSSGELIRGLNTIEFLPNPIASVDCEATPAVVLADGVNTTVFEAYVKDTFNNPAVDGTNVTFALSRPDGLVIFTKDAVTTGGLANVTYTVPQMEAGSYTLTCNNPAYNLTDTFMLTVKPEAIGSLVLNVPSNNNDNMADGNEGTTTQITADGQSSLTLRATLKNTVGNAVRNDTVVKFTTTAGTLSSYTAVTLDGSAEVLLTSTTKVGEANVVAESGGAQDNEIISFVSGPPATLQISASPASLPSDGESESTITLLALDAFGNPAGDNFGFEEAVTFSIPDGEGTLDQYSVDLKGSTPVTVTFTAPASLPERRMATITATTTNNVSNSVNINLTGPQIGGISLTADPETLPADSSSTATIFAEVSLTGGGAAPDGTIVNFEIISSNTGGASINPYTATTGGGFAVATVKAGSIDDTLTIRATSGGRTSELDLPLTPGQVDTSIVPNSVLGTGVEEVSVRVKVTKADGNPAALTNVDFSLSDESMGTLSARSAVTDALGEAKVTLLTGSQGGDLSVTATWTAAGGVEVEGSAVVTIQPSPANILLDSVNPSTINIRGTGGESSSLLTFTIKDAENTDVADGYRIDFQLETGPNGGEETIPRTAYTKNGKVTTTLRSGYKSGPVSIKATYFNDTNVSATTSELAIANGPPVGEEFSISPAYKNISGLDSNCLKNLITVSVGDVNGQAVPEGTSVTFKTYNTGGLFPAPASIGTDSEGEARKILTSADQPVPGQGFVSLTAEVANGGRTTKVTSISVDPLDTNFVYVGTNGGGVYKSTDGGVSWKTISRSSEYPSQNWIQPYINDVLADPTHANLVFAATGFDGEGALYRSFDGGFSWNSGNVEEIRGAFRSSGAVLTAIADNTTDWMWIGTSGQGVWYTTERTKTPTATSAGLSFTQCQDDDLGDGTTVVDIVRSPNTHGATATLYAATSAKAYVSHDGGKSWDAMPHFSGSNIQTLEIVNTLVPGSRDLLYAGTAEGGLWMWDENTNAWTNHREAMGGGVRATTPMLTNVSIGNGIVEGIEVGKDTKTEDWSLVCVAAAPNGGTFNLIGATTNPNPVTVTVGNPYVDAVSGLSFTIIAGQKDFEVNDEFTFKTIRDPGTDIRDILVDTFNHKIYALSYFFGDLEPHAVGSVYRRNVDAFGAIVAGVDWVQQNSGLPEFNPPSDDTLFALSKMAMVKNSGGIPVSLLLGGEGIHLNKAVDGINGTDLLNGNLSWSSSETGLTNLLMARTTVLFSGTVDFKRFQQVEIPNTSAFQFPEYEYSFYLEDEKGNPPIAGSAIYVELWSQSTWAASGAQLVSRDTLMAYNDEMFAEGTWRDQGDAKTNRPFNITLRQPDDNVDNDGEKTSYFYKFVWSPGCNQVDESEIATYECVYKAPGCSGGGSTRFLPYDTETISVKSNRYSLPADGVSNALITADVLSLDGLPLDDGTPVTFSAESGTLQYTQVATLNGSASVLYTAGKKSGNVKITASAIDPASLAELTGDTTITLSPSDPATMTLTASPETMVGDGASQSTLSARVKDANGNNVQDGTSITFQAYNALGQQWGADFAATTTDGIASALFNAFQVRLTEIYTILATTSNGVTGTVQVTLTPEQIGSVDISSSSGQNPPEITANGTDFVSLRVTVRNSQNVLAVDGTEVSFTTTAGTLSSYTAATAGGIAQVNLTSPKKTGSATVTATVQGVSDAQQVRFVAGPAAVISAVAVPDEIDADGTSNSTINITVTDINGNPIANDGQTVLTYSVDYGQLSQLTGIPFNGQTTVTYTAASVVPPTTDGKATVTIESTNGITNSEAKIKLTGSAIDTIELSATPQSIPIGGNDYSVLNAQLGVSGGGEVGSVAVVFSILSGQGDLRTSPSDLTGSSSVSVNTSGGGSATVYLFSANTEGSATVRASASEVEKDVTVTYVSGKMELNAVPASVLATGNEDEDSFIEVKLESAGGGAVPLTNVVFTLDDTGMGGFLPSVLPANPVPAGTYTAVTDANGEAKVRFRSFKKGGTVAVTGTWTPPVGEDVTDSASILVLAPPASIEVADLSPLPNPDPAAISIAGTGGASTSVLVFDVLDANNDPVADNYRIDFTIASGPDAGEYLVKNYELVKDGKVQTILKSGFGSGSILIQAIYHNDRSISTAANLISIGNGPPAGEASSISSQYLNFSGLNISGMENLVTAYIKDYNGQGVPAGTSVSFFTYDTGGGFPNPGNTGTTDDKGIASLNIMSGAVHPLQGFGSITAQTVNSGRTKRVGSIAIVPGSTNRMYAGTNGGGVYRSTDAGSTWESVSKSSVYLGQNYIAPYINDVAVDPDDPNLVFATTGWAGKGAVYRSFDGGTTWNSNNVEEVFGLQQFNVAASSLLLDSGGSAYMWMGTKGQGLYWTDNCNLQPTSTTKGFELKSPTTGLNKGENITDIIRSKDGSVAPNQHLYAGSLSGAYESTDGGDTWAVLGTRFAGDLITVLETFNTGANDVVYAGTNFEGIWDYSPGTGWNQHNEGLGEGVRATTPVLSIDSEGNGSVDTVTVSKATLSESWTLVCVQEATNGGLFNLLGSVSDANPITVTVGTPYVDATSGISFTIVDGEKDFKVGDTFTFRTVRDPGREITGIYVDWVNKKIYISTYFWGQGEEHAVGNVYVRNIDPATGLIASGVGDQWVEVNTGLPMYDSPEDISLYGAWALAGDNTADPVGTAPGNIYLGMDGINMYRAIDGQGSNFAAGSLGWKTSKYGLDNDIMARGTLLFSGPVGMTVCAQAGARPNTDAEYYILVQDTNGNPPVQGSSLIANTYKFDLQSGTYKILDTISIYNWSDEQTARATWRDPDDYGTYAPIAFPVAYGLIEKVEFIFTPHCWNEGEEGTLPGCSGTGSQTWTFYKSDLPYTAGVCP